MLYLSYPKKIHRLNSNKAFKLNAISILICLILFLSTGLYAQNFKYKKGYYHLLNEKGKTNRSIKPFSFAGEFKEGLCLVEKDLKFGFINPKGNMVIDFKFYNVGSFSSGLAYASLGGKYGYINKTGEFVIAPNYEIARNFEGDFSEVLKTNPDTIKYGSHKWIFGIVNKKGKLIGDRYFSSISYNKADDRFKAKIRDSIYYISHDGIII